MMEPILVTDGVTDFPDSGASLLVINNVTESDRGSYFCVSYFKDGTNVTSEGGFLELTSGEDKI